MRCYLRPLRPRRIRCHIRHRLRLRLADLTTAVYFSAVTYTTTGYGDLVPPVRWRILGASEAMVGMVLLGWSVGLVLVLLERMNRRAPEVM